jgi:hypothetical protein
VHPEYLEFKSLKSELFVLYPLRTLVVSIQPLQDPPLETKVDVHDELVALFPETWQGI